MQDKELYQQILGLSSPWTVADVQHPDYDFRKADVRSEGKKLEKNGAAMFLDMRDEKIELLITGVKRDD